MSMPGASTHSSSLACPCTKPPRQRDRAADHAPGQDALEVVAEPVAAQHDDHEQAAADLHHRVAAADHQPPAAERLRQRRRHGQAHQHQGDQQQPHRHLVRIQPVRQPGRVRPHLPDQREQNGGLQRSADGR
jgi:hypothetical protein